MNDWYRIYAHDDFQSNHWQQLLWRCMMTCGTAHQRVAYSGMTAACCSKNAAQIKLLICAFCEAHGDVRNVNVA